MTFDFITPFERPRFKLPEKHKIIGIGQFQGKLWPSKLPLYV